MTKRERSFKLDRLTHLRSRVDAMAGNVTDDTQYMYQELLNELHVLEREIANHYSKRHFRKTRLQLTLMLGIGIGAIVTGLVHVLISIYAPEYYYLTKWILVAICVAAATYSLTGAIRAITEFKRGKQTQRLAWYFSVLTLWSLACAVMVLSNGAMT